jgi:hypothetical protein
MGVAVVAAPWAALDSTLRGVMDYYLERTPIDVVAYGVESGLENATRALAAVPHVERAEPVVLHVVQVNASASGLSNASSDYVGVYFVSPTFGDVAGRLGIAWDGPPTGGAVVPQSYALQGLRAGGPIVFETRRPIFDSNNSVIGEYVRNTTFAVDGFFRAPNPSLPFPVAVFLAAADLPRFEADLNLTEYASANVYGWLDRAALLDPYDAAGTSQRLRRQLSLMRFAVAPYGFDVAYGGSGTGGDLVAIFENLDQGTLLLRLFFVLFAIPTLGLAALLARVGFDVGLTERRRELAVLRARGLSLRGVRLFLRGEALILGSLAAAVGVLLAIGLSRLFSVPNFAVSTTLAPSDVRLSSGTILLALLIGWLLALGASHRGIKLLASEDIVGGLKAFHAEEVAIPHKASRDFLLAGVAVSGILLMLASGSLEGSPLGVVGFLLGFSTFILAPLAPFFLTAAIVRYLTRGTTVAYRALSRLLRPAVGDLELLVEKNIARAPRRASNTAVIVTFAVAFVLVVSIIAASSEAYRREGVLRQVPSDVVVQPYEGGGLIEPLFTPALWDALRAIPGVEEVTPVLFAYSNLGTTIVFEASTFLRTVPWLTASHLGGADPASVMAALDAGGTFAATQAFQAISGLRVGDVVYLGDVLSVDVTARLAAVVRDLPGLAPGFPMELTFVDFSTVPGATAFPLMRGVSYLVAIEAGADPRQVAQNASAVFGGHASVVTQAEAFEQEARNPMSAAVFSFLTTQTHVALLLSVLGVGLLVYTGAALRREEFATLVARGARPRTVAKLVMAEGWVVSLLGLMLGVVAGLVTAATFLTLASIVSPTQIPFVVPATVLWPLLAAVLGVWVASFMGALSIQRMDVARALKLRGG